MDLNSSSDEEEAPVAAPPQAQPAQAPSDPAGGATAECVHVDEGSEEVRALNRFTGYQ